MAYQTSADVDELERRQQSLQRLQAMVCEAEAEIAAGRVGPFNAEETMHAVQSRIDKHLQRDAP
jgi:hypothetical protein